jgi:hypothetical protein
MSKFFIIIALLSTANIQAQKTIEPGLIDLMPEGIVSSLTDLAINNNSTKILAAGFYGRIYEYDISENSIKQTWKNNSINSLKSGATITYSHNEKYVIVKGLNSSIIKPKKISFSAHPSLWQGIDDMYILDAANGNELLHVSNAYCISVSNNTAFVSDEEGYKWYNLPEGKLTNSITADNNECAAISPSGKYIIVSWDADKQTFGKIETIVKRRKENKNARKAKKLVFIYSASNMQEPLYVSSDEVDVVTNIDFDEKNNFAYLQTQTGGIENRTDLNMFVYERISLTDGTIDRSFAVKGNFCKRNTSNTKISSQFAGGTLGLLKDNRIQSYNTGSDSILATFTTRYKLFNNATLYSPLVMHNTKNLAYLYYDKTLLQWDFETIKKYFKKGFGMGEAQIIEAAKNELDDYLEKGKLAEGIKKRGIVGNYIMDITLVGPKATVQTVFCESDEKTNIQMQNELKDIIRQLNFVVEIPKNQRVKFKYTFQL